MSSLLGQIALVSGASRGIGAAIARQLGQAGATLIGTATTVGGVSAIQSDFDNHGISGQGAVLDIASQASVDALFEQLKRDNRLPSILVNNAGVTRDNLLVRMSVEEWDTVINTNLSSLYRMCRGAARQMMKARGGRIINVSSVVGATGNAGQANYAAAKAGVVGFTKALARELGSRGITVNAVAPGFVDTDMTRGLSDQQKSALVEQVPLKRFGAVDDVAAAVTFLAGPGSAYITGETLHVNGGMYMG